MTDNLFRKYNGAMLPTCPPHEEVNINRKFIRKLVIKNRSLFARYTTGQQITTAQQRQLSGNHSVTPPENTSILEWWHCVLDHPISLESLSAKQRYRIKRGLKNNLVWKASPNEITMRRSEIAKTAEESFRDYPEEYKPHIDIKKIVAQLAESANSEMADVWLCENIETKEIIGYSECLFNKNSVNLNAVKVNPDFLSTEVNAALAYTICHHYINERGYDYICDGERNIRHQSNYQDFLERVLGFRKAYCKLNVIYHPLVKPIVYFLYPFRELLNMKKITSPFLYNIYCLLKQEEIARKFRK